MLLRCPLHEQHHVSGGLFGRDSDIELIALQLDDAFPIKRRRLLLAVRQLASDYPRLQTHGLIIFEGHNRLPLLASTPW